MALAPRTLDAYRSDWADFAQWCAAHGATAFPAGDATIAAYLEDLARTRRPATLQRRLAAIRSLHRRRGAPLATDSPAIAAVLTRSRWRSRGVVTTTNPITIDGLRAMSVALPDTVAGARDRAVLLVGYGGALSPSEIVHLTVGDVRAADASLELRTARGRIEVPSGSAPELCSVAAWNHWRTVAPLADGPAFRSVDRFGRVRPAPLSVKAIGRIVRRAAAGAGLEPTGYSGRSLRRGMVAAAAERGVGPRLVMHQTGHRSRRLVRGYMAEAGRLQEPSVIGRVDGSPRAPG